MISFRFHLVSIVAVLLALAVGISLGSGFVGEQLQEDTRERIDAVRARNTELNNLNEDLQTRIANDEEFAIAAKEWLIDGALLGRQVTILRFEQTAPELYDAVFGAVEEAEGEVDATVTLTDKFALEGDPEREELALVLASTASTASELRNVAAERLARVLTRAAAGGASAVADADQFVARLEDAGFVAVERGETGSLVSDDAVFVVLAGGSEQPPFPAAAFVVVMGRIFVANDAAAVAIEPSENAWGLVEAIRSDDTLAPSLSTVDGGETVYGHIATVLGIRRASEGLHGHYGRAAGASSPLPQLVSPS